MKISKHIHSCLLLKQHNQTILIDPGNYTAKSNALDVNKIDTLDFLLYTHQHADHLYVPLLKTILAKFPNVKIISNNAVKEILAKENISVATIGEKNIEMFQEPHEKVFDKTPPENSLFKLFENFIHPGDNVHFTKTADIVALPIQAPWVSLGEAVEQGMRIKPRYIIPIHDWHWKDDFRKQTYERLETYFKQFGITFLKMETGEVKEITTSVFV